MSRSPAVPMVTLDPFTGVLTGPGVIESRRTIGGLAGYFRDEAARAAMDQSVLAYRVLAYEPRPEGVPGAVCCATTFLEPGLVGDEYFLTRGHFHQHEDRPELEVTVAGEGVLILMTEDRVTWAEPMLPGSVHHVAPRTAHRVANIGTVPLVFVSYWPSETGHDYQTILDHGFAARMRKVGDTAVLIPADSAR
jgi:glucose-6-phosphate isomerase